MNTRPLRRVSGVAQLFSYGGVTPQNVMPLVHGCIFTRGPKELHRTAIFVGDGSGHGPGACMLMAAMRAVLRTHPELHGAPGPTLGAAGAWFRDLIPSDAFIQVLKQN